MAWYTKLEKGNCSVYSESGDILFLAATPIDASKAVALHRKMMCVALDEQESRLRALYKAAV